jgi:hypothetical protein
VCSTSDPNFDINTVVDARTTGAEVNLKSYVLHERMTALNYAAFYGCLEIVDFLLKMGAGECIHNLSGFTEILRCKVCTVSDLGVVSI